VGQGDSALLVLPSKKIILIDAGGKPGYVIEESEGISEEKDDAAKNVIIPYLKDLGTSHEPRATSQNLRPSVPPSLVPWTIDYFIATHPHADHYGGFVTLMENKIFPKTVYDAGFQKSYPLYETFLEMIKNIKAKYVVPKIGETVDLGGGVLMKFLGPISKYRGTKSDENNSSIVVKITYGNISMLFTGDVELEAENDLVSWRGELKSTVLKIAHHGSKTSTSSPFLDRVAPEIAVISSGSGNPFGHPSDDTIKKLVDRNINIYRTDQNGTITLLTDGTSLKITTER
jgi:competence protein ComEC